MDKISTDKHIERVVNTYADTLQKLAFTYLHTIADAQDISQEAFLRLLECAPRFRDGEHEKAWLIRVTINLCKDRLRRADRRHLSLDEALAVEAPGGDRELLREVLALPESYRTVLHLHYYEGYTVREIAAITKRPVGTVATLLTRGRQKLKIQLEGDYDERLSESV